MRKTKTKKQVLGEFFSTSFVCAKIGRWLSPDPKGQYYSPYLVMGNNPINGVDPDGGFYKEYPTVEAYWAENPGGRLDGSDGHWLTSDRINNTYTWAAENTFNIKTNNKGQYEPYAQVNDFYKWVRNEAKMQGHEVRWMNGAIGLISDLDFYSSIGMIGLLDDGVQATLGGLNKAIADATLPFFDDLLHSGTIYKGEDAYNWDVTFITYEQGTVALPFYSGGSSSETLQIMNSMVNGLHHRAGLYQAMSRANPEDFGKYGKDVWDTKARIDIPLNMLYPNHNVR